MDDAELERLAVNELLREAEAHTTSYNVKERKQNQTLKPNKNFLGRTLNSVIAHNKREDDRTHRNCRNKLRALEERRHKRLQENSNGEKHKHKRSSSKHSENTYEILSSSDNEPENKHSSLIPQRHSASRKIKRKRRSRSSSESQLLEAQCSQYAQDEYYSQYFDQLAAYALASKSYYQVGKWLCYQALLAGTAENSDQPNLEEFFNINRLENYGEHNLHVNNYINDITNDDTICLSSGEEEDVLSNCALSFLEDVECQLIDEELSDLQSDPLEADTIELSDSSDDDNNDDGLNNDKFKTKSNKNVSIDLTSD